MGLFDAAGFYESFTPPSYDKERGALNPMIWGQMNKQMAGKPTPADWGMRTAMMQAIGQNFKGNLNTTKSDFAGRGVFDSGWMQRAHGGLLNQRAGQEADATKQFWQNIMQRQMAAQGMASQHLAGARAGSGTYTTKG